jgi:molecular chaperone GrpE
MEQRAMTNETEVSTEQEELQETTPQTEDNVEELHKEEAQSEETEETVEAKADTEDFKSKYYYLAAEMQNIQRRFDKEKEGLLKFGSEKILKDLLEVVDNFERTLGFIKNDEDEKVKNIVVGIDMITKQMLTTLEKHGLKQVEAIGELFDPNFHEAITTEAKEGTEDETITHVHQNGYTLNERLLRPAKVTIVKN